MKSIKILLLSSATFTLSACTFFDDTSVATARQEYLGWYCEVDIDASDQWRCSERMMSDALPIDKVPKPLRKVPKPSEKKSQRVDRAPMPTAKSQAAEQGLSERASKEKIGQQVE